MPGLHIFRRKWLIACDDLVIPFAIETVLRSAWLISTSIFVWINLQNCSDCKKEEYAKVFLYILLVDLIVTTNLSGTISWISSRGYVMQTEKRRPVTLLLYLKLATSPVDLFIACSGVWLGFWFEDFYGCIDYKIDVFIKITSICLWLYILKLLVGMVLSYNPLGSPKYLSNSENEADGTLTVNYLRKAKKMWSSRLRTTCCCLGVNKKNDEIYEEMSTFLVSFFKNTDLVPTDILAGLIILNKRHASERKRLKFVSVESPNNFDNSADTPRPEWMTVENADYFLRLAKSAYGWPMFFDTVNPCNFCVLTSHIRCCGSCFNQNKTVEMDNCCYCNTAALQKITGYNDDDLIYVSYQNGIYEPAFYVAFDHKKSCVVVCIRGTVSLSDLVTDLDADCELVKVEGCAEEFSCHRGTIRGAYFILKKLTDLRILRSAFAEHPHFTLAVTGHSLGGSIGAALCIMLRSEYPNLRCYVYGPLAVLDEIGIKQTLDFTFTVIVGDDMSARLCLSACENLRTEITKNLEDCNVQKYKILSGAFCRVLNKLCLCDGCHLSHAHKGAEENGKVNNAKLEFNFATSKLPSLYAPGRILFLEKTSNGCQASWVTGPFFNRIIVSLGMLIDHQPHTIQKMLEIYAESCQSEQKSIQNGIGATSSNCHNEYIV